MGRITKTCEGDMTTDPATLLARAGVGADAAFGSVMPPLYTSSTYIWPEFEGKGPYDYARTRCPNRDTLARLLAALEGGAATHIVNSGMAALTLVLHLLTPDDTLLAPYDCYSRAYALMRALAEKGHFRLEFVDTYDTPAMCQMIRARAPRMVLIESPSNPVMRVAEIAPIVAAARALPAPPLVVCDTTFMTPLRLRPLALGADIVLCSTTKYVNGHSDVVGGAVTCAAQDTWEALDFWANSLGISADAFSCHMTLRGARTLPLRLEKAEENAHTVAQFLEGHPRVTAVHYPGLPSHPHHARAGAQQDGFGAMVAFEVAGDVRQVAQATRLFALAQSLGGVESLINHPASMTHFAMGPAAQARAGVTRNLLRLSVGVEAADDLIADLAQALEG